MREQQNQKSIMVNGERKILYRSKDESWFLDSSEAIQHRNGHSGQEALELITGHGCPRYPFTKAKTRIFDSVGLRAFRHWLGEVGYDTNAA